MFPGPFRNQLGYDIFLAKYAQGAHDTWEDMAERCVRSVCYDAVSGKPLIPNYDITDILRFIKDMKFIPGGRYLYYAGRPLRAFSNCFIYIPQEDTREEWARTVYKAMSALTMGGGIGIDYSVFREKGATLKRTGGTASGPIPLMHCVDLIGSNVVQGGSRRSAMYASLNWRHPDAEEFIYAKDWANMPLPGGMSVKEAVELDFNYKAPLSMTNMSLNFDDAWINANPSGSHIFKKAVMQAVTTGEPGFSFNFGPKAKETGRNACCEVVSSDDCDSCNLGSINMARIDNIVEFDRVVRCATMFLMCGLMTGVLPDQRHYDVRAKNNRLGLGLMGIHEWLAIRELDYRVNGELRHWLSVWKHASNDTANYVADIKGMSRPVAVRAIAPTGTLSMVAGTTSGIEPIYSTAYIRRYLVGGEWKETITVDTTAERLHKFHGINPDDIETAHSLASDPEKRIAFQADVQTYTDNAISSTLNLPSAEVVDPHTIADKLIKIIPKYAHRLRGLTVYPDGARGGQPIVPMAFRDALARTHESQSEDFACKSGVCGV